MLHYRLSETNLQCRRAWSGGVLYSVMCVCVFWGIKLTKTVNHRMKTFINVFFFSFFFISFSDDVFAASQQSRPKTETETKEPKNFHKQTSILKMLFYAVLNLVPLPTFAPCRSSSMCMLFSAPYFPDTHSTNYNALRMRILPAYTTSGCLSIYIYAICRWAGLNAAGFWCQSCRPCGLCRHCAMRPAPSVCCCL